MGPRAFLDGRGKSRPLPGFDPRTFQAVASRYTDWAIPAHDDGDGDDDDDDDDNNNNNNNNKVPEGWGVQKSFRVFGNAGFEVLPLLRPSVILLNPSRNVERYTSNKVNRPSCQAHSDSLSKVTLCH
jgi:hypothetical protein